MSNNTSCEDSVLSAWLHF